MVLYSKSTFGRHVKKHSVHIFGKWPLAISFRIPDQLMKISTEPDHQGNGSNQRIMIKYRKADKNDEEMLRTFLYHAIYVPPGCNPPNKDIAYSKIFIPYTEGFGTKTMDMGIIAENSAKALGAAWLRLIEGYGHIDDETPELSISVLPEFRGQGIGTALLAHIIELAKDNGCLAISLSVQKENKRALDLYMKNGFRTVKTKDEEIIMKLET